MKVHNRYLSSHLSLLMTSVALASAVGVWGCSDSDPEIAGNTGGSSGSGATAGANSGGKEASGGANNPVGNGGKADEVPTSGGASSSGGSGTGGAQANGGQPSGGLTGQGGELAANGGASVAGADQGSGGSSGGAAPSSGGASQTGGASTGTGGATTQLESICTDDNGDAVPYDYSFGLMSEYAFELSMNCSVGGYIMPLVLEDPEMLTKVDAFVVEATDWYRSEILKCKNDHSKVGPDAFGLLPASQTADLSKGDFEASESLFFSVISRHDGLPDGVSAKKKDHIKGRINSIKAKAVHQNTDTLTKPLSEPDCMPTTPP